jgi:hypothetical protein
MSYPALIQPVRLVPTIYQKWAVYLATQDTKDDQSPLAWYEPSE